MEQILRTKLFVPRLRPEIVSRSHLLSQISAGLHGKVTLISGPAGFGKTTLVADWIAHSGKINAREINAGEINAAWLSLDPADNDLLRFFEYLIAALQTAGVDIDTGLLSDFGDSTPDTLETTLTALVNIIAHQLDERGATGPQKVVLILDDYHVIDEPTIHAALTFLITHAPPQLHIIFITRTDPPLPLARLRARRQMTEIREAALRFRENEAAVFLNETMHLDLTPEDVATLEARTEGWIASLQLAALAMQAPTLLPEERHEFVSNFAGSDRYVADYLVGEVLDHQSPLIESFLLQTAILDRLNASLCDYVRNDRSSQAILEDLERTNLFVQAQDNQRTWYRYHQLFSDLLRHRLRERYPDQRTVLHDRASQWFADNGYPEEAIEHAFAAEDHDRLAQLIEPVAHSFFSHGKMMTLHRWLSALPVEQIRSHPQLYLLEGWLLYRLGQFSALEAFVRRSPTLAEGFLSEVLQGELLILHAHSAYLRGDFDECGRLVERAFELIPATELSLRMPGLSLNAWCYDARNEVEAAIVCYAEIVRMGRQAESLTGIVSSLAKLVQLHASIGENERAVTVYDQLESYVRDHGNLRLPLMGPAHIGMGLVRLRRGEVDGEERLREGIRLCQQWGGLRMEAINGYIVLIGGLRECGQGDQAQSALAEAEHFAQAHETPAWMVDRMRRMASASSMPSRAAKESSPDHYEQLTQREMDVLRLMVDGLTTPQIAETLIVGVSTVRTHVKRIYAKLDVHNRHEAIARARELDLL